MGMTRILQANFLKKIQKEYCGLSKTASEFKPDLLSKTRQTNTVVQNTGK